VYCYLTAQNGTRAGASFLLDRQQENTIGRGTDCRIVVTDALCSRIHAKITFSDDAWWLWDAGSRNGTYVGGHKVDGEARLMDGVIIRLGSTEFIFRQTSQAPLDIAQPNLSLSKTVVFDEPVSWDDTIAVSSSDLLDQSTQYHDFLVLYQLSIRLLGCSDPNEVIRISLEVAHALTGAAISSYLWTTEDGQMTISLVQPEEAVEKVVRKGALAKAIFERGRSYWMRDPRGTTSLECLEHFSDAICLPVQLKTPTPSAVHLYREQGSFEASHYQFAKSLALILDAALARARKQATLEAEHRRLLRKSAEFDELLGDSEPMQQLKAKIVRIAHATGCLLIRGESGVGKELVARAVHRLGARADRPLLSVNCAAIPRDLMESQLFGHKRGSFTGAEADHIGWFEQADTGTLFLDEVGEMTLEGQAKLLRILDGYPFLPVGGTKERRVDVRVIAATNRDLRDFVREGRFREDLYYRLTVFELYIPPLRDRGSDINLLIDSFLDRFKAEHGRPGLELSDAARQKLLAYEWPGNVRQLRNVIDSAVVMADGHVIQPDDLGLRDASDGELPTLRIDHWERKLIVEALKRTDNNMPTAAKLLGISRATLYRKVEEYDIPR
jgi:Nif-specific regulatory protein